MVAAQAAYEKSSEKTDFSKKMDSVWEYLKKLFRLSLDTKFIATRRDAIILNIPILIPIVALFAWGATIWLVLIGLFFCMRTATATCPAASTTLWIALLTPRTTSSKISTTTSNRRRGHAWHGS